MTVRARHAQGRWRVWDAVTTVDPTSGARVTVGFDVTDRWRTEQVLRHSASYDDLTGLANRTEARRRLADRLARLRRHGGIVVVACLDLDGFKAVNDTHGHATGDAALVAVATVLRDTCREEDLPGRVGGYEFVVLLADLDLPGVHAAAARLQIALSAVKLPKRAAPESAPA